MTPECAAILAAVLEGVDIPGAATVGEDVKRAEILDMRLMHTVVFLRGLLEGPGDLDWQLGYFRERLAEHPPTGYVTSEQVRARLAEGATWTEAVQPVRGVG